MPSPYAHGYKLLGKPPATDVTLRSPSLAPGSGAIISTVQDVADFYRALLSGRLLRPNQLQAMKTTVSYHTAKVVAGGTGFGLGIGRTSISSSCVGWSHAGAVIYFEVEPGDRIPSHVHTAEEILFVVAGEADGEVGDEHGLLRAGSLVDVPAHVRHRVTKFASPVHMAVNSIASRSDL